MSLLLKNRYQVLQILSEAGGFGQTFLAEDTDTPSRRRCVIKKLRPVADAEDFKFKQERFHREAAILERLGDFCDQIPKLYAYFAENQEFYLVQELIDGLTLKQKLQREGALDENTVRGLLWSLLDVLKYVHAQNIIHRDIKPDNIILRQRDNKPVLIDFGIVKEVLRVGVDGSPSSSVSVGGTPGYMASEQAAGRPVFASDLYSLGATAIYLLTGRNPQQMTNLATGDIAWQQFAPQVSTSFATVLNKATESHARDRYKTTAEMREDLQRILRGEPTIFPPPVQEAIPIIENTESERESELRSIQTETKTAVRQQIREASERIVEDTDKTEQLVIEPIRDLREIEAEKLVEEQRQLEEAEKRRQAELEQKRREAEIERQKNIERLRGDEGKLQEEIGKTKKEIKRRDQEEAKGKEKRNATKKAAIGIWGLAVMILGGLIWAFWSNSPSNVATNKATNTISTSSNSPNTFNNSIGMEFVKIPSGSFMMGSPTSEKVRSDNETQHRVTISKDFYMGKYEVTQAQWKAIMGSNRGNFEGDNLPVEQVNWDDTREFIEKLNTKGEGTYRLPTEAEWEYAARGGNSGKWSFGDDESELGKYAWYSSNAGSKTHEVGTKQLNKFGLYDMYGNVWEWCQDWYGEYPGGEVTDPTGATNGPGRVGRGGGWNYYVRELRSAYRIQIVEAEIAKLKNKLPTERFPGDYERLVRFERELKDIQADGAESSYLRSAYRSYFTPSDRHAFLGFRLVREN
jgi:formylglycine-generating enzyme required for sulfatase activity